MPKKRPAKRKRLKQKRRETRPLEATEIGVLASVPASMRVVIVHYHLFKNAGSSVDAILQACFGERYGAHEFPPSARGADAVADHLAAQTDLKVLSTHTALLPAPKRECLSVFPILFARHPIDRLRSAYGFERTQKADTPGAILARETDFAGYLRELLSRKGTQARNFQTARLAFNEHPSQGSQLERALRAIALLPFVGLVECFEQSIESLAHRLKPIFPDFAPQAAHRNASQHARLTLAQRLDAIKRDIGVELYDAVRAANEDDLTIFRHLAARYGFRGDFS